MIAQMVNPARIATAIIVILALTPVFGRTTAAATVEVVAPSTLVVPYIAHSLLIKKTAPTGAALTHYKKYYIIIYSIVNISS